jgi:hypothetical protein
MVINLCCWCLLHLGKEKKVDSYIRALTVNFRNFTYFHLITHFIESHHSKVDGKRSSEMAMAIESLPVHIRHLNCCFFREWKNFSFSPRTHFFSQTPFFSFLPNSPRNFNSWAGSMMRTLSDFDIAVIYYVIRRKTKLNYPNSIFFLLFNISPSALWFDRGDADLRIYWMEVVVFLQGARENFCNGFLTRGL